MFESLGEKFEGVFRKLRGQKTLTEDNIKDAMREVRLALLEADVNYLVVKDFVSRVRERAIGEDIVKGVNPAQQLFSIVHKELVRVMTGDPDTDVEFVVQPGKRNRILLLGLQGSGKTTFSGKLANHLREKKCKPLLVACDVYRPAAVEQIKQVGGALNIPVFELGTDKPVLEIIAAAEKYADANGLDSLIIDTAGRLQIDEVKMDELTAIKQTVRPDYTFLVADAMTGQDAVNSAKGFNEEVGIDGVCLTKLDGDARGGAALSIKAVTGKPIVFVGVGEKSSDLELFHPDRAAQRILGMGDVVSLVEKAQEAFSEEDALSMQEKMGSGKFSYDDFLGQMKMIRRMGSLKGLLGMLPGMGNALKNVDNEDLTNNLKRVEAMILSMTEQERSNPELVRNEGTRRQRIAKGSGHQLVDVNNLVKQFEQMRGAMQQMMGAGMLDKAKGMFGGGGMPDPSQLMGGMPPGAEPNPRDIKKYKRMMKAQERTARPASMTKKKNKKKRRK
ncbi:MAG: signal recognition particle protein [Sumerlaeia bacterium]